MAVCCMLCTMLRSRALPCVQIYVVAQPGREFEVVFDKHEPLLPISSYSSYLVRVAKEGQRVHTI